MVVQPVLACSVLLALPMDAIATNRRLSRTALFGAAATATGLATFLLAGRPSKGHATAGVLAWSLGAGTIAVVLIACVVSARSPRTPQQRGALWAVAAACCYGLSSACMKQATTVIGTWSWHMFVDPAVIGCVKFARQRDRFCAFQVASLPASMGLLTAVEPVAGAFLGMVVFDEHLRAGAGGITATAAGAMVTIVGVLLVTSSSPRAADERTTLARFDVRSEDSVFEL